MWKCSQFNLVHLVCNPVNLRSIVITVIQFLPAGPAIINIHSRRSRARVTACFEYNFPAWVSRPRCSRKLISSQTARYVTTRNQYHKNPLGWFAKLCPETLQTDFYVACSRQILLLDSAWRMVVTTDLEWWQNEFDFSPYVAMTNCRI